MVYNINIAVIFVSNNKRCRMNQSYDDEMGLNKALGCKPAANHSTTKWIAMLLGGALLLAIGMFVGSLVVQGIRLHCANDEATELAARVKSFTQCGELESYRDCVDRAVAKNPKRAFTMLSNVKAFLDWRADPSEFVPLNVEYQGDGWPVTSLRVDREQLSASLESYRQSPIEWEK